ncbi:MAG: DMT family transporter [Peptostreptococcaceae bacterium]|nr:DMT family transporter [Peptostreptococcaceae bacterium]
MEKQNKKLAAFYMILSSFSFSMMQLLVKSTASELPLFEQVFVRNSIVVLMMLYSLYKYKNLDKLKVAKDARLALLVRSFCGFMGIVLFFNAMRSINLADAAALQKCSPFFVMLFSCIILKEKLTKAKAIAIMTAFAGVLLIVKPQFNSAVFPALLALCSAVFSGMAYTMISFMKNKVHSHVIIFYFGLFSCIICLPLVLFNEIVVTPKLALTMLGIGILGGLGQTFLTSAYKLAVAGEVSIYNYSNIIFSASVGYFIFGEVLDWYSILGIMLIISSGVGVYVFNKE